MKKNLFKKTAGMAMVAIMSVALLAGCQTTENKDAKEPTGTEAVTGGADATNEADKTTTPDATKEAEGGTETRDLVSDYAKIKDEEPTGYVGYDTFDVGEMKKNYKIGICVGTMGSAYFKVLPDKAKEVLESFGCEVLVADANADIATMVSQIENMITQGVDGLLINSVDPPSAVSEVLQKATEKGIPIVAVDSRLDGNYKNYLGMIGSDNFQLGFACGEYMANKLKEKKGAVEGTLCVLDGVEGNVVAEARYKGLLAGFESVDKNHKIKEVSHLYGGSWTEEAGVQMAEDMLVANPEIDLMFGISDPFVVGATTAAQRAGRSEMIMGAVDGAKSALKLVSDGTPVEVIAGQDPMGMGEIGSKLLLGYLNNGTLPETRIMKIAPKVSTPESVSEFYDPNSAF